MISLGGLGGGIATSPGPTSSLSMSVSTCQKLSKYDPDRSTA